MPTSTEVELIYCFSYSQYQTDGKLDNAIEALEHVQAERICLYLTDPVLDDVMLDPQTLSDRLARIKKAITRCKRNDITVELVLPGLLVGLVGFREDYADWINYLKNSYSQAAELSVQKIWADDSRVNDRAWGRKEVVEKDKIIRVAQAVSRSAFSVRSNLQLGLIAALPEYYSRCEITADELARELAGIKKSRIAQSQHFRQDKDRTEILFAAQDAARAYVQFSGDRLKNTARSTRTATLQMRSMMDYHLASSYHKSAEAAQMQINLNVLFGLREIMLNCFDQVGTAPGAENPYLVMHKKQARYLDKLAQLLPDKPKHAGLRVITTDQTNQDNCWPILLWRLGMPASLVTPAQISDDDTAYVLTGTGPRYLNRDQLEKVFQKGVLVDALAAQAIQEMGRLDLLGLKVGGPIKDVQLEIFSDQTFAAPYYGYRSVLKNQLQPSDYRLLQPVHQNVRLCTSLLRKNSVPNTVGMVLFDNQKQNQRAAILPYSLNPANYQIMLRTERQRHYYDVFNWLLRHRLAAFVENTPDLVPFIIPDPGRKRIILALLNISFDWAIDVRIRLARIPFKVKQIRKLDEHGKLEALTDLQVNTALDYQYIQLTPDTAVPPMQMTTLLLEG